MKKLLTLFAAGALLLGLASCGKSEAKKLRVGVSIPAADHGWTGGIVWSAEDAKKRLEAANPDLEIVISTARDAAEHRCIKEQGIHHLHEWQGSQALSWCQSAARQRDCRPS